MRSLLAVCLLSLVSSAALAGPKVTAKTTDLYPSKKCKEKIKGQDGQDPVLTCPAAVKGYDVTVGFSAVLTQVTVTGDGKETSFSGLVGKKLEWRLVDGKPATLLVELADADDATPGKSLNQRVAVYAWGTSTPKSETKIDKKMTVTKAWAAARVLADKD